VFLIILGLSLTALSPAAAWFFIFLAGHFCPYEAKMTCKGSKTLGERRPKFGFGFHP
jgi:hypothetical protein